MIIRSQDKKSITNFQQLTDVGIIKTDIAFAVQAYYPFSVDNEFSKMNLGFYSTEEKAIKVLDMIEEAYGNCESVKALTNGIIFEIARKCTQEEAEDFKNEHRKNFVFQIPQDSEV